MERGNLGVSEPGSALFRPTFSVFSFNDKGCLVMECKGSTKHMPSWWFQVSTHLKNISEMGSFPQVGVKIKNGWNHHLDTTWKGLMAIATPKYWFIMAPY